MMATAGDCSWESLPATALVSIFRKLSVSDRFKGGPLVCKAWNDASRNPRCWESMLPDGESPEFHFIKNNDMDVFDPEGNFTRRGVRAFVNRSCGSVTTLYLPPPDENDHDTLFFIAQRCPKLKHLSLGTFELESEAGFLMLIHSCKDLELIDLGANSKIFPSILQEMGRWCLGLRGLRHICVEYDHSDASIIATSFPKLQLLNLHFTELDNTSLLTILDGCTGLRYLDVTGCSRIRLDKELAERVEKIPEFLAGDKYDSEDYGYFYSNIVDKYLDYDDYVEDFYEEYGGADLFAEDYEDTLLTMKALWDD